MSQEDAEEKSGNSNLTLVTGLGLHLPQAYVFLCVGAFEGQNRCFPHEKAAIFFFFPDKVSLSLVWNSSSSLFGWLAGWLSPNISVSTSPMYIWHAL